MPVVGADKLGLGLTSLQLLWGLDEPSSLSTSVICPRSHSSWEHKRKRVTAPSRGCCRKTSANATTHKCMLCPLPRRKGRRKKKKKRKGRRENTGPEKTRVVLPLAFPPLHDPWKHPIRLLDRALTLSTLNYFIIKRQVDCMLFILGCALFLCPLHSKIALCGDWFLLRLAGFFLWPLPICF